MIFFLPLPQFYSIWDRVIGGSCMILVYLAVAILLSFKRKIFGFSSAEQLQHLLHNVRLQFWNQPFYSSCHVATPVLFSSFVLIFSVQIPKDNFGSIVSKAIELWDSHGSPLSPSNLKFDSSPSHELYDIEDYSWLSDSLSLSLSSVPSTGLHVCHFLLL